ncbi:hypothetical protein [Streptomyces smyrnaeus]|uniref:hypothetical protein n=1 Tax=Streptomyces smyrnaeus TaxID=1387713 RepID=UPI0033CA2240
MLYDLSNSRHHFRMDDLRREAEHERLVRMARAARREQRGTARSWLRRSRGGRDENEPVWVRAA